MLTDEIAERYWTEEGQPGFEPAKAYTLPDAGIPETHLWVEPKIDGARALMHVTLDHNDEVQVIITSRRKSRDGTYRQWQDNLPQFRDHAGLRLLAKQGYWIFDGEVYMESLSNTMSVIGAKPIKAIAFQKKHGWAKLTLFDALVVADLDITDEPLHVRRLELEDALQWVNMWARSLESGDESLGVASYFKAADAGYAERLAFSFLEAGYEGAVIKRSDAAYFARRAWYKFKESFTIDACVVGFIPGQGKYKGQVGSLKMAVWKVGGGMQQICSVAPGDDTARGDWTRFFENPYWSTEPFQVFELECQSWGARNNLRHPRILRKRPDLHKPNCVDFSVSPPKVV